PEPVKFSFIGQVAEEQRQLPPGVRFPVVFMCRMLEVTRQGYYEWKKRPGSAHDQKDAELAARIRYLHQERHKNRAGIERILWDLQEEGFVTSGRRVRRRPRACSACIPGRRRGRPCRTARQSAAWSIWWTASSPPRSRTSCGSAISPIRLSSRLCAAWQPERGTALCWLGSALAGGGRSCT